jgi:hypothetical protein
LVNTEKRTLLGLVPIVLASYPACAAFGPEQGLAGEADRHAICHAPFASGREFFLPDLSLATAPLVVLPGRRRGAVGKTDMR